MSATYNNRADNSDIPVKGNQKDNAGGFYDSLQEMNEYTRYVESLIAQEKLIGEDGKKVVHIRMKDANAASGYKLEKVPAVDLLPPESEFDVLRKHVIISLNRMKEDQRRLYMARFDCESMFECSSKITNFLLDNQRRDQALTTFGKVGGYERS